MRIRVKLLVLLLAISLVPLGLIGAIGHSSTWRMGHQLADRTRDVLIQDAGRQLRQVVDDHAALLNRDSQLIELIVRTQVREVERALAGPGSDDGILYSNELDAGDVPADFKEAPRYFLLDSQDRPRPILHSTERPIFTAAPGVDRAGVAADARRLAATTPALRFLYESSGMLTYWHYTALETGLHSVYPGHGGYPDDYDPRQRRWYTEAVKTRNLVWIAALVDASTRRVIQTVAAPVRRPDGTIAGATGIDIVLTDILESVRLPDMWSSDAEVMVVVQERRPEGGDGLLIITQRKYRADGRGWKSPIRLEWLNSEDKPAYAAFEKEVMAHQSGVTEMPYNGRASLWAYGSLDRERDVSLVVILPRETVVAQAESARADVLDQIGGQMRLFGAVIAAVIVGIALLAYVGSRSVTRPVSELARAAQRIAEGDFEARASVMSHDELGALGRTFNAMVPQLEDRLRLREGLAVAQEIQQHLLPGAAPRLPGLDVAGLSRYCDETGGDYYDFVNLSTPDRVRLGIAVGDVTGHGIAAALLMATARALLRRSAADPEGLGRLLEDVNHHFSGDIPIGRFMTLFCLVVDATDRTMVWSSAGHDPAIVYDPTTDTFDELPGEGMPLGIDPDERFKSSTRTGWNDGQVVLIGTDGIWEARNPHDEPFGKDAVRAVLRKNAKRSADEIAHALLDAVTAFRADRAQEDDITLVVVKLGKAI